MSDQLKNDFHSQAYLIWLLQKTLGTATGAGDVSSRGVLSKGNFLNTENFPEQKTAKFNYKFVKKMVGDYEVESVMNSVVAKNAGNPSENKKQNMAFFDMETHKLSSLVPELRLYKVLGSSLVPFYFPIVSDFSPLENSSTEKTASGYFGGNTTIENFSVTYQGQDFFTDKKYLVCNLMIKVDSLANIFLEKKGYARLADLFALRTDKKNVLQNKGGKSVLPSQLSNPSEIVAVLGYSFRDHQGDMFTEQETREITENIIPIRMNPGDHTINLAANGTATIDIEYTAWLDSFDLDRNSYNTFSSADDILREAELKVDILEGFQNINDTRENLQKIQDKAKRREFIKKKTINKQEEIRSAVELIEKANRFYYIDVGIQPNSAGQMVSSTALQEFLEVPYLNQETKKSSSKTKRSSSPRPPSGTSQSTQNKVKEELNRISSSGRSIHFFLLGDLIEAFCRKSEHTLMMAKQEVIRKSKLPAAQRPYTERKKKVLIQELEEKIKKLNNLVIMLSDITLMYANDKVLRMNLADIPISSEIFQEFVFSEIINVRTTSYTIKDFLKGCYSVLLPKALNDIEEHAPYVIKNSDIAITGITYSAPALPKSAIKSDNMVDPKKVPGPNVFAGANQVRDGKEYYILAPQPNQKVPTGLIGDRRDDIKNGIYHFHLGKSRGLIKNISFSKFNIPDRREALMINQVNIYDELKMPYSANITMFGNNLFMPGSKIYIDPFSVGFGDPRDKNSAAAELGLGGYYIVLTVRTSFTDQGNLTTNLECSFASFPESTVKNARLVKGLSLGTAAQNVNSTDQSLNDIGSIIENLEPPYEVNDEVKRMQLESEIDRQNPIPGIDQEPGDALPPVTPGTTTYNIG